MNFHNEIVKLQQRVAKLEEEAGVEVEKHLKASNEGTIDIPGVTLHDAVESKPGDQVGNTAPAIDEQLDATAKKASKSEGYDKAGERTGQDKDGVPVEQGIRDDVTANPVGPQDPVNKGVSGDPTEAVQADEEHDEQAQGQGDGADGAVDGPQTELAQG